MAAKNNELALVITATDTASPVLSRLGNQIGNLSNAMGGQTTEVIKQARSLRQLRQAYTLQYSPIMDTFRVMKQVGSIGKQLLSVYTAMEVSQINVREATEALDEAQKAYNESLRANGIDSVLTKELLDDVTTATEDLAKAQESMQSKMIQVGLTAVGIFGDAGMLMMGLKAIGVQQGTISAYFAQWAGLAPILVPIAIALSMYWAASQNAEELQNAIDEMVTTAIDNLEIDGAYVDPTTGATVIVSGEAEMTHPTESGAKIDNVYGTMMGDLIKGAIPDIYDASPSSILGYTPDGIKPPDLVTDPQEDEKFGQGYVTPPVTNISMIIQSGAYINDEESFAESMRDEWLLMRME